MSGFGGADYRVPLYAFVFLVTPGIGYNIFLMTRVREQAARRDTRRGALVRLAATDGVITSAGCVVAATFTVLAMLPSATLTEIGLPSRKEKGLGRAPMRAWAACTRQVLNHDPASAVDLDSCTADWAGTPRCMDFGSRPLIAWHRDSLSQRPCRELPGCRRAHGQDRQSH